MSNQAFIAWLSIATFIGLIIGLWIGSAERDSKRRHPGEDTEHGGRPL